MRFDGRILPVIDDVDGKAWENFTANDGRKLLAHGKILPKHGRKLPPNKVLKKVYNKPVRRARSRK
jgi:hypothetical protein